MIANSFSADSENRKSWWDWKINHREHITFLMVMTRVTRSCRFSVLQFCTRKIWLTSIHERHYYFFNDIFTGICLDKHVTESDASNKSKKELESDAVDFDYSKVPLFSRLGCHDSVVIILIWFRAAQTDIRAWTSPRIRRKVCRITIAIKQMGIF